MREEHFLGSRRHGSKEKVLMQVILLQQQCVRFLCTILKENPKKEQSFPRKERIAEGALKFDYHSALVQEMITGTVYYWQKELYSKEGQTRSFQKTHITLIQECSM